MGNIMINPPIELKFDESGNVIAILASEIRGAILKGVTSLVTNTTNIKPL